MVNPFVFEDFVNSPSRKAGVSEEDERFIRWEHCNAIVRIGKELQLKRVVFYNACALFHQFFMRESITRSDPYVVAAAALFLASKTNYDHRFLFDVVQCFHTWHKEKKGDKVQKLAKNTRAAVYHMNEVKDAELKLAQFLEFDFEYILPLVVYATFIRSGPQLKSKCKITGIDEIFYEFLHSVMMSPICVIFSPEAVCAAGMYLGCKRYSLNNSGADSPLPKDWMKKVDPHMDGEFLQYLCQEILAVSGEGLKTGMCFSWDFTNLKPQVGKNPQRSGKHRGVAENKKSFRGAIAPAKASPNVFPTPSPASQKGKFPERTLYFTNVAPDLTEEELRNEIKKYAPVKVLTFSRRRPNIYGFVKFLNKNDMYATLELNGKMIKGKKIRLEISGLPPHRPNPQKKYLRESKGKTLIQRAPPPTAMPAHSNWHTVFVGLLPRKAAGMVAPYTLEQISNILEEVMSKFGKVAKIHVNRDLQDGFVYFEDEDSKERALIEGTFKLQEGVDVLSVIRDPASSHAVKVAPKDMSDHYNWNKFTTWDLATSFLQFGVISETTLVENKNYANDGLKYSHGIVRFNNQYSLENALSYSSKHREDFCLRLIPNKQGWTGNGSCIRVPVRLTRIYEVKQTGETSVYIENLPNYLDEKMLKIEVFEALQQFGKLVDITIERNPPERSSVAQRIITEHQEVSPPSTRAIVTFREADCQKKALHRGAIVINNVTYNVTRFRDIFSIRAELTVACHNIPQHFKEVELRKAMEVFGEVEQCSLRDKKTFAYSNVRFYKRESAEKAISAGIVSCGENNKHTLIIKRFYHMPQGRTLQIDNIPIMQNQDELEQTIIELILSAKPIKPAENEHQPIRNRGKNRAIKRAASDPLFELSPPQPKKRRVEPIEPLESSSSEEGALPDEDQDDHHWSRDCKESRKSSKPSTATVKVRYSPEQVGLEGINCYDQVHANIIFKNQRQAEIAYAALQHRVVRNKKLWVRFQTPLFHRKMLFEVDGKKFRTVVIGPDLPINVSKKTIDMTCSAYGVVEKIVLRKNVERKTQSAFVTFEHHDGAARAVTALNEREVMDSVWQVSFCRNNQGESNKMKGKAQRNRVNNMQSGRERHHVKKVVTARGPITRMLPKPHPSQAMNQTSPRFDNRPRAKHPGFRSYAPNQVNYNPPVQPNWPPPQQHHPFQGQLQVMQRQTYQVPRPHPSTLIPRPHNMALTQITQNQLRQVPRNPQNRRMAY